MKISFCEHNKARGKVLDMIKKYHPEFETSVNKCIGECNKCGRLYIARVDGKLIKGDTAEELYNKIIKFYV